MYLRVALGQAAADGVPVVASLALAWVRSEPSINLRMPAVRCAEQFEKLFTEHYTAAFGAGMVLPCNRTKLKFVYRAASSGLMGGRARALNFDGLPDRSEEHTSELQSPMRISYAVFCLKNKHTLQNN